MNTRDEQEANATEATNPEKKKWWPWVVGILFLLVFCDDDKKRDKRYCYTFGEDRRICFPKPLPEKKDCYLESDDQVRCYDR